MLCIAKVYPVALQGLGGVEVAVVVRVLVVVDLADQAEQRDPLILVAAHLHRGLVAVEAALEVLSRQLVGLLGPFDVHRPLLDGRASDRDLVHPFDDPVAVDHVARGRPVVQSEPEAQRAIAHRRRQLVDPRTGVIDGLAGGLIRIGDNGCQGDAGRQRGLRIGRHVGVGDDPLPLYHL